MTPRSLAAAAGLALVIALGGAGSVAACSMIFPPTDEVLAEADLIFEGEVTAVDGARLTIGVTEVYRGNMSVGSNELGSDEPASACAVNVQSGQTIIVATDSLAEPSLAGVWWVLDDGTLGTLAPEPPAATADAFRATLRGLPDTRAMRPSSDAIRIGLVLLAAALALTASRARNHGQER